MVKNKGCRVFKIYIVSKTGVGYPHIFFNSLIVQAVNAQKDLIVHFVNSHGAFAQVFKMLRERHVPRPQMISSILIFAQNF